MLHTNDSEKDLGPYPAGAQVGMVNYANFHQDCIDSALTPFMQYLPFLMLLQAVSIILVEKLLTKFPRVSGKIERFYGTIVEDALFGKDPDVAEDFQDDKCNVEAIARRRRRNEVCNSLKRSSIIHNAYILKNIVEILILAFYIPFNIYFAMDSVQNLQASQCIINILEFPQLGIHDKGQVFFNCEAKKVRFFLRLEYCQIAALCVVLVCSICSITWCIWFRNISKLLEKIAQYHVERTGAKSAEKISNGGSGLAMNDLAQSQNLVDDDSWDIDIDVTETGKDFLFLFDLLAHTAGMESTMRVLTHADDTFRKICLPKLKTSEDSIKVFEDKLKIKWKPASLERWLENNHHKSIEVDSYDVTIFPAESSNNSVTKHTWEKDSNGNYHTVFYDLQGGKTEYIVTIACVIGKSRMKGERIVTTLKPYGPEKPRGGKISKSVNTHEVEIDWEPPKGGFTKYVLLVDNNGSQLNNPLSRYSSRIYKNTDIGSTSSFGTLTKDYTERDISHLLTNYKITGLSPGEVYGITLLTKTGSRFCSKENAIYEKVLTSPHPVQSFTAENVDCTSATVKWIKPEKLHAKLKAFNLIMSSNDGKYKGDGFAVKNEAERNVGSYKFENIQPATEYKIVIKTVCVFEALRTVSEDVELSFCTLPEAPTNIMLSYSLPNSLTIKWDPASCPQNPTSHKYKLSIDAPATGYIAEYSLPGEKNTFVFSKLQDGEMFNIKVEYIVVPYKSEMEVRET